jgi:hypothetical protein
VRPLASSSSSSSSASSACGIAAVTVPDASLDREVQACGRGYANAHQQCCRLSLVTLTASHRQHPAYSHEPAQGPQPTTTPGKLGAAPDAVSPYAPPQVCIRTASSSLHPICSQPQRTCDTVWPSTCCVQPHTRPAFLLAMSHSPLMSSKAMALPRDSSGRLLASVSCLGNYRSHTRSWRRRNA